MVDAKLILQWFSRELVERIETKGVTHRQVAFRSRTTPHSVMGYIQGDNFPNPLTLILMAEYLDCTIDELLGYKDVGFVKKHRKESAFDIYPNEDSFTPYLRECIIKQMKLENMTAETLAQLSGVNLQTIKRYLCVHSGMPQMSNLLRMCDALGCTPSELIGY